MHVASSPDALPLLTLCLYAAYSLEHSSPTRLTGLGKLAFQEWLHYCSVLWWLAGHLSQDSSQSSMLYLLFVEQAGTPQLPVIMMLAG
jgi:hypothetical protein